MNVMEIVSGAEINGAAMHCLLLSRELARRGHRVTLVCRAGAWIEAEAAALPIAVVPSDLSRWPPRELRRIAGVARAGRVDVLHTHMSRAHFFGVLLRWWTGIPCVATAHNRHFQLHWMLNDRVIAVSEATRRYHRRRNFVRRDRIDTIHNFVDYARLAAVDQRAGPTTRAGLGLDPSAPLLGTIGTVIPRKGLAHLIEALVAVRAAVPDVRLLIVGDQPAGHAAELRALARRLGVAASVLWAGRRADVPEILAALDVVVLASLEEPFGLVAAEAMAAGVPVVATTAGGLPECVSAGETGLLVPPGDSAALAAALVGLLHDAEQRRRLGAAGRCRVRERFTAESQMPRIEAVLAGAAGSAAPALREPVRRAGA